jgi:hypothetical protein
MTLLKHKKLYLTVDVVAGGLQVGSETRSSASDPTARTATLHRSAAARVRLSKGYGFVNAHGGEDSGTR